MRPFTSRAGRRAIVRAAVVASSLAVALLVSTAPAHAADAKDAAKDEPAKDELRASEAESEGNAKARAKAAFEAGRNAMADEDYAAACQSFEQSYELGKGAGAKFNWADCEEHRGHLVQARELFVAVGLLAHDSGQTERETLANERVSKLDAQLSRVKIELTDPDVSLALDTEPLPKDRLSQPIVLEPGKHELVASAPGKREWKKGVELPSPKLMIIVNVPALEDEPAPPVVPPPPAPPAEDPSTGRFQRHAAIVVGAVGLGFTVAGIAAGWAFLANKHDAQSVCPAAIACTEDELASHQQYVDDAQRSRTWTFVGLGVGTAALAGAAALYFTAPRSKVHATTSFAPDCSFNVAVRGGF